MKAIISQPMKGKTREQIMQEREPVIKELEAKGYEIVDTVYGEPPADGNIALKCLALTLKAIADVDFVYFMQGWENARGCKIEHQCCMDYNVPFGTYN